MKHNKMQIYGIYAEFQFQYQFTSSLASKSSEYLKRNFKEIKKKSFI